MTAKRFAHYDLPLAVFLLSAVAGLLPAYDRSLSWPALAFLLGGGLVYFLVSRLGRLRIFWDTAAGLWTAVTALAGLYFITQAGHMDLGAKIGLLDGILASIARFTPRLAFWTLDGNTTATLLEGGLFLTTGLALAHRRRLPRVLLTAGTALVAVALLLTASRGAWLAAGLASLLWAGLRWKPARWLWLAAAAGLAGLALVAWLGGLEALGRVPVAGGLLEALFFRPDRVEVYRNSLALIRDVPFTGIGLGGQFAMAYSRYELLLHVPFLYYAHNLYLEIWLEQGLAGICAWIGLAAAILISPLLRGSGGDAGDRLRFEASWAGLAAILIHALTDARQSQALVTWLPLFLLLGLNAALLLDGFPAENPKPYRARLARLAPAAAAGMFLLGALAWTYPWSASVPANRAALLQHRADLSPSLSQSQREDMLADASRLFTTALSSSPSNFTAASRLGLVAFTHQDYEGAIPTVETAHALDPHHPGVRRALGLAYTFTGRLDEARPLLQGQLTIVEELQYWQWFYGTNGQVVFSANAGRMADQLQVAGP